MKGLTIGHYSDFDNLTGCTVFLFKKKNRAIASVRGGAPGSRELNTLAPGQLVEEVNAIVFSGGSAPGLGSMEGAVQFLRERGIGYHTKVAPIPIVAGGVIYDLEVGNTAFPQPEWVYMACSQARENTDEGSVGIGTGATVGKSAGIQYAMKSGFGWGISTLPGGSIQTFVVTNALGDIYHPDTGEILAGRRNKAGEIVGFLKDFQLRSRSSSFFNTTLVLVVLDFFFSREDLLMLSHVVHSALATCIRPYATLYDGDTIFMVSMGESRCHYLAVLQGLYQSVTEAVLHSVLLSQGVPGLPSRSDIIKDMNRQ